MGYETGMLIMYDVVTKAVFVEFRGQFHTLHGPDANRDLGIKAGEDFCRSKGWQSEPSR